MVYKEESFTKSSIIIFVIDNILPKKNEPKSIHKSQSTKLHQ